MTEGISPRIHLCSSTITGWRVIFVPEGRRPEGTKITRQPVIVRGHKWILGLIAEVMGQLTWLFRNQTSYKMYMYSDKSRHVLYRQ